MIVTFYSYKGGVGRSMAVANVADLLARRGLKVLMVDFDLEAPGLEQFFQINVDGVRRNLGLLDLLLEYKQAMSAHAREATFADVARFICPVYEQLPADGRLDILPAGQRGDADQLARYARNLRIFDWQDFYYDWEGELFFEWLRKSLTEIYDLVVVDSRTGVTEMGGICGYQLADVMVMLCAPNHQNVLGTESMLRDFRSPNVESLRRGRPLEIIVVPARVEQRLEGEAAALLDDFQQRFDAAFAAFVPKVLAAAGLSFRDLAIPYEPHYSFEELVVSDPARAPERRRISGVFERLAGAIAMLAPRDSEVARAARATVAEPGGEGAPHDELPGETAREPYGSALDPPISAIAPTAQYDATRRFAGYDVFLDYSHRDDELARRLVSQLEARNLQVFFDQHDLAPGSEWRAVIDDALHHSNVLLYCVSGAELSEYRQDLLDKALRLRQRGQLKALIPVLLPGVDPATLPPALGTYTWLDLRDGLDERSVERLHAAVQSVGRTRPAAETETRVPFPGSKPFEERQSDLLFGREAALHELIDAMSHRVSVLVGPSGSGKTSLIRAGLLPALRRESPGADGRRWRTVLAAPGVDAARSLADALDAARLLRHFPPDPFGAPRVTDDRRTGNGAPSDSAVALESALGEAVSGDPQTRLLLVVDQAEQLFRSRTGASDPARLLGMLARWAASAQGAAALLLVARSEALPDLVRVPELAVSAGARYIELPNLSAADLRHTVTGPAERVGLAYEPGLVERIVSDMTDGPGALSVLQELLLHLWEKRRSGWLTNSACDELGGVRGVVVRRFEGLYARLDAAQQAAMRSVLLRFTRLGSDPASPARRVGIEAVLPANAVADATLGEPYRTACDMLVDAGLLISSAEDGKRMIEPAHGLLIRGSSLIASWVTEERGFLEWRARLTAAIAEWRDAGESSDRLLQASALDDAERVLRERGRDLTATEERFIRASVAARESAAVAREQRRRIRLRIASTAALVFFVVALLAVWKYLESEERRNLVESEREKLDLSLGQAQAYAEAQRLGAQAASEAAEKTRQELQQALADARRIANDATSKYQDEAARRDAAEQAARRLEASLRSVRDIEQRAHVTQELSRQNLDNINRQKEELNNRARRRY